jgi:hypothetical protein
MLDDLTTEERDLIAERRQKIAQEAVRANMSVEELNTQKKAAAQAFGKSGRLTKEEIAVLKREAERVLRETNSR